VGRSPSSGFSPSNFSSFYRDYHKFLLFLPTYFLFEFREAGGLLRGARNRLSHVVGAAAALFNFLFGILYRTGNGYYLHRWWKLSLGTAPKKIPGGFGVVVCWNGLSFLTHMLFTIYIMLMEVVCPISRHVSRLFHSSHSPATSKFPSVTRLMEEGVRSVTAEREAFVCVVLVLGDTNRGGGAPPASRRSFLL